MNDEFFLPPNDGDRVWESKPGNEVTLFTDNRKLFYSVLADLSGADGADDFAYFVNWWCDVDIPLGDPAASPSPPLLRSVMTFICRERPDPAANSSQPVPQTIMGAQVCGMIWRHKRQHDLAGLPAGMLSLPVSIFGDPWLAAINTAAIKHIRSCSANSLGILDGEHRLFGSHHQKFLVVRSRRGLVAYVGSTDFNADRIFAQGGKAKNPPTDRGAPLEDVSCRITGPVCADVLKTFVDRWKLHDDSKNLALRGDGYADPQISVGNVSAQVTHTYGDGYPFKGGVRSCANALLRIIRLSSKYIYFEDQYLIGTNELGAVLRDRLNSNVTFTVVGVMSPIEVVGDLRWLTQRRSDFWRPLIAAFPGRVMIFEMLNLSRSPSGDGSYLHAKLSISDDAVAMVGSMNFSNRSATHDSEMMVTLTGDSNDADKPTAIAARLRLQRWTRHLGVRPGEIESISDGLAAWRRPRSTALVRAWVPSATPLSTVQRQIYERFFDPA
ncbi:phospholipase D-like domain-containing protein [Pseudomonas putida]|uniref:phospholipase D-like domain-containing protein n=1 Tax=Pseudomonas putida TaxID=303 RepID=UPI003D95B7D9